MLFEDQPAPRQVEPPTRRERRCRLSWTDGNGLWYSCYWCPRVWGIPATSDMPLFELICEPCEP